MTIMAIMALLAEDLKWQHSSQCGEQLCSNSVLRSDGNLKVQQRLGVACGAVRD